MAEQTRQDQNTFSQIEAKRQLLSRINEILTPELKHECPGLAVMVLTIDEYEHVINALKRTKSDMVSPVYRTQLR